jgi:all-trans-retinol 13,14-reductase
MSTDETAYFGSSSPDTEWDEVVIGSGISGMTAAALLSTLGHRVLVLEHQQAPGGFTHPFSRDGWTWDVGVHAVGEMGEESLGGRAFRSLTNGRVRWARTPRVYDEFVFPDLRIGFPDNERALEEHLRTAFPRERVGDYLRWTRDTCAGLSLYQFTLLLPHGLAELAWRTVGRDAHLSSAQTTQHVLDRLSTDARYKAVLAAQWGYMGSPPARSSWLLHASVTRSFFEGCYYPAGGSGTIADGLLRTVARQGGWTRVGADVTELVLRNGRVQGVRLAGGELIRARRVVCAAGARNMVERMLPESLRTEPWARSIAQLPQSPCHVGLYLGFKGDIRAAGASATNTWLYDTWDHNRVVWPVDDPRAGAPTLYVSFPSLKDPLHVAGGELRHTGEALAFVPFEVFARWRDAHESADRQHYAELKQSIQERMVERVLQQFPALRPMLAYAEVSTPLATERWARSPRGAIYGLEATPARYANRFLRPRMPVPGLYLAGADVFAMGVAGAMAGGVLAAGAIETRRTLGWLRTIGWPVDWTIHASSSWRREAA